MDKITSCYGCKDRTVGCHGTCERYLADKEKAMNERLADTEKRKQFSIDNYFKKSCSRSRKYAKRR